MEGRPSHKYQPHWTMGGTLTAQCAKLVCPEGCPEACARTLHNTVCC